MTALFISMKFISLFSGILAILSVALSGWLLLQCSQHVIDTSTLTLGHAQIETGLAQIRTSMRLMELSADSYGRWFLSQSHYDISTPAKILEAFNASFFTQTQARLQTPGEILGWGPTFFLPPFSVNKTQIQSFYSSKDITGNGTRVDYTYCYTLEDGITSVVHKVNLEDGRPVLGQFQYEVFQLNTYLKVQNEDDWWDQIWPWISSDGSVYLYLTYQRRFEMNGVPFVMETWESIDRWHEYLMESVVDLGESHLVIIDDHYRLVDTTLLQHLDISCSYTDAVADSYINCEAPSALNHSHPLIRDMAQITLLLSPGQTRLTRTCTFEGRPYYVMVHEVIQKGSLKLWVVWAHAEEPLTHEVHQVQVLIISCFCAAIAMSSVFVVVFSAAGFLHPLSQVIDGMRQLRSFEFGKNQIVCPGYHVPTEVRQLQQEFQGMWNAVGSFAKYVPKEVVRDLLVSNCGLAQLGMQDLPLTFLFMDIVDFTSICEKMNPETLSVLLTHFFSLMTDILLHYNATIDKFIGDAIVSFWGAPLPCQSAEHCACCAALEMYNTATNQAQSSELKGGRQPFNIRIGIHSGQALCGNIGGPQRMAFTAIGQTVNIAAALEGLNKTLETSILISHDVYLVVSQTFLCRYMGFVKTSAAAEQSMVYELHGVSQPPSNSPNDDGIRRFSRLIPSECFPSRESLRPDICPTVEAGLKRLASRGLNCNLMLKAAIDDYSEGVHHADDDNYNAAASLFRQAHVLLAGLSADASFFPISRMMAQAQAHAARCAALQSHSGHLQEGTISSMC